MQMWAVSNLPVYTVDRDTGADKKGRSKSVGGGGGGVDDLETALLQPPLPSLIRPVPFSSDVTPWDDAVINSSSNNNNNNNNNDNFDGLLEPSIDGPPSPESIRRQTQRASVRDKHHSHATSSSGSVSLRSLTSADRPSWENVLEAGRLSRKSSGRSTSSSMPPKDRPESVQFFGKSLFNRRGRLRRENSAQSSANSSVYGGEMGGEPPMPAAPTSMPSLFGRRRGSKQEQAKKIQISGPYGFQHVTHTQKDSLPDLTRTNRQALAAEFAQVRASQMPADGVLRGIRADNLHFDNFSSESLALGEEEVIGGLTEPVARSILTRPPSGILKHSPRRLLKRSQSQDALSMIPPPRPPRSPIEATSAYPPIPPPRTSSRMGSRHERFDSLDRSQFNPNFRYPQSFPTLADAGSPPPTSYGYIPGPDMDVIPEHTHTRSHSRTPSMDDPNWPLPCSSTTTLDSQLPDVPEEEEAFVFKKSRASIISNSSLRGSVSVPMLRGLSLRSKNNDDRRVSEASETLGRFDLAAAQRALEEVLNESGDGLVRDSWEDDIDYCYDHEVEADCDYEWQRPSFELSRDCDSATPVMVSCDTSPVMLSAGQFDVPALSPVSQLSMATAQEAITPTVVTNNIPANFSLPKIESNKNLLHVRKPSDASSFKESHGFTLSPSLLIPNDFQQQMMAHEVDEFPYRNFDDNAHRYRTSASTTHTLDSIHSGFEKHISTASTSTDFTRLTTSTTSLDTDTYPLKPEPLQRFPSFESTRAEGISAMPTLPESEEVAQPLTRSREFRSRGSESNLLKLALEEPVAGKAVNSLQARRGRARTTSLSTPPPPNQYTLFPSVQLTGNRI
ncbi:hypothetical protein QBC35DRAFT_187762 [Podospora australis]|uniref:CRIB domain-containing protein n=1 Tax=Podospora australis TaxID=1536484 RepID=A0AAN7AJV1_9PEZI|nr:hypothetical protein QBC35DRAFT_187762 [Podospora australis]